MARVLLSASGIEFDSASKLEQALVGTFLFGMICAEGMSQKLTPAEVHAHALLVFKEYRPAGAK